MAPSLSSGGPSRIRYGRIRTLVPAIYTLVVTIENQFVSPYLLGRRLELNHVALLLAIAFWGWIWGLSGIVLAVPLLVTLKVFSSHFEIASFNRGIFDGGKK